MAVMSDLGAFDITTILPEEIVEKVQAGVQQVTQTAQQAQQLVGEPKPAIQPVQAQQPAAVAVEKPSLLKKYGAPVAIGLGVLGAFWAAKKFIFKRRR